MALVGSTNPEIDQDRVEDLFDMYKKYGYVMFPQQVAIYEYVGRCIEEDDSIGKKRVLEVGCGNGIGSAILERVNRVSPRHFTATDKLQANLGFAKCLYPWIDFQIWDINGPVSDAVLDTPLRRDLIRCNSLKLETYKSFDIVVAIEVFEHVANPQVAMDNLIAVATDTVWMSTPNANVRKLPPDNPYHVWEYTPDEILKFACKVGGSSFAIHDWETGEILGPKTERDPLLYRIGV